MSVRLQAARCLARLLAGQGSLATLLPPALERVPARDRALLQELCYGVCRRYPALDALLAERLARPLKSREHEVRALLLLGLHQLLHTRIPAHAAIGETVACCNRLGKGWARGLVNAVLRSVQRQPEPSPATAASVAWQTVHPDWLVQRLQAAWPDHGQAIIAAGNGSGPLTLRANRRRISRDELIARLQDAGVEASPTPFADSGLTLARPCDVTTLPGFADGLFSVQDEAAQLAATLLAPPAGARVLDACAAPGGKTAHLLEQQPGIELTALELNPARLMRIGENLARLGLEARILEGDAAGRSWWDGKPFDAILADVPCSATGVIRRNPDIKLLRRPEEIDALGHTQQAILANLWSLLKPGGRLLYATCSVLPEENERVVASFLSGHADAREIAIEADWGIARPHGRQLFPQPGGHDGFYYALLEKQP